MTKEFSYKQVFILVFAVIVCIAVVETNGGAIWTWPFLKEFFRHLFVYGAIVVFVVVLLGKVLEKN